MKSKVNVKHIIAVLVFLVLSLPSIVHAQSEWKSGVGRFTYGEYAPFASRPVDVHYYIPNVDDVRELPIVFVFEGGDRGYSYLLDAWRVKADEYKFMVLIPHFDLKRYPLGDYQEVGVVDKDNGEVVVPSNITPVLVDKIFEYVCGKMGSKCKKYSMYGHSAGGQFVHRAMLFNNSKYVDRAIVGCPGWYTFPDTAQLYPYGVKNIPYVNEQRIKEYLARDIVLQLALGDTIRESFLRKTPQAELQGRNRLERGRNFYAFIKKLAQDKGWEFNWKLVEEPGLGHVSVEMGQRAALMLSRYRTIDSLTSFASTHPELVSLDTLCTTTMGNRLFTMTIGNDNGKKMRVWMQAALHGNEPAGVNALQRLVGHILTSDEGAWLLKQVVLKIAVANVDGYVTDSRRSGDGNDLNRDYVTLTDSITRALKQAMAHYAPHVAMDIHEYNPRKEVIRRTWGDEYLMAGNVLMLPSGNLNIAPAIRDVSHDILYPGVVKALNKAGYTTGQYYTVKEVDGVPVLALNGANPRSTSTNFALQGAASVFIEIRREAPMERRIMAGYISALEVLRTTVKHAKRIKKAVKQATKWQNLNLDMVPTRTQVEIPLLNEKTGETHMVRVEANDALLMTPK